MPESRVQLTSQGMPCQEPHQCLFVAEVPTNVEVGWIKARSAGSTKPLAKYGER
jgi:hypothetical protein